MRREEREGGRNQPFCGTGSSAVAGGPEGKVPECQQGAEANSEDAAPTESVAKATEDAPPLPEVKPADGPAAASAQTAAPKKVKTKSASRSTKHTFKREVDRLRRFFSD
jgi:hypothetical protein